MENELLRLKLRAEFGADTHSTGNLDPAIENDFLNYIMAFERGYENSSRITIFDFLGNPQFIPAGDLTDEELPVELAKVEVLLAAKNIMVDYIGSYDDRTKYLFVTEELFEKETDNFSIPGMMTHFTYEEFHPDHKMDIENRAKEFLTQWAKQTLNETSWCLDNAFVLPDSTIRTKAEVAEKLKQIFACYQLFTDFEYDILAIDFTLQGDGGMGFAEGIAKYKAILENGDKTVFAGPFKLYLSLSYDCWSIYHIIFPGFEY